MYIISICIRDTNVSMISLKNSKWHRLIVKQSYKLFIKLPITSFPIDLLTSGLVRTDLLTCTTFYERKNSPLNHVYNLISNIFIHRFKE